MRRLHTSFCSHEGPGTSGNICRKDSEDSGGSKRAFFLSRTLWSFFFGVLELACGRQEDAAAVIVAERMVSQGGFSLPVLRKKENAVWSQKAIRMRARRYTPPPPGPPSPLTCTLWIFVCACAYACLCGSSLPRKTAVHRRWRAECVTVPPHPYFLWPP